jgi:hypothetical protein
MIGAALDRFSKAALRSYLGQYEKELAQEIVGSCDSLLDIGCGAHSPIRDFSHRLRYTVGVDTFAGSIDVSRAAGIHNEYYKMDALEIGGRFAAGSFDAVIALDLIEHLPMQDGYQLIAAMERVARKKVVIITPNGFQPQRPIEGNPFQAHVSGWSYDEMRCLGYRIRGLNGWRPLRGELTAIRWQPKLLWENLSLLSQALTTTRPRFAYHLLCVKDIQR